MVQQTLTFGDINEGGFFWARYTSDGPPVRFRRLYSTGLAFNAMNVDTGETVGFADESAVWSSEPVLTRQDSCITD
ncbi:MAG: hypothetical protein A3G52_03015 [Candidatus Taylorbacteria bacterium RIFCSPLOWO2_12_FULL_43_20]|uniref:Uncharacterized protein n=1 Tax=Candidatus Taylorbacteria bacterium RIFCSPLOWO2_12_FULL_43_20 TaxID=1802332 RepID=A0A1G2P543_9BACT|nr:MAG: hypothetical protein A2825_03830 [Candidatus Taylorbacteria bacterium RIFCSPHIGHO2_01_FULL_43_120]OHA22075.1 MAG: hypothetical protein A3B98_04215 [Candidatus Taylorbacteria bacterium RIFCSPHIGHO2_02_FULL_43_55]OHA28180.1 MAG: hypothetical protein A3E92_02155 [Candidatus Taylorbacteria bacterium RIFCSPHIGHO2_12_FULL_42_34]OHA31048.1 MAG: hypothetical protein A3B09_04160 [Candidatus Taylorbacteria bacterium RIFCSPLOWO2_01_FULL_43_83]OHA39716.1 MAG: hypothetical protein A3H58_04640 [Candi